MKILAIETSCDETAISCLDINKKSIHQPGSAISSQIKLHAKWGGVVPELAARQHTINIIPLLKQTLEQAKWQEKNIDIIAVTSGPGLITSLHVGVASAKALAAAWHKPLIGINHISGHLVSPFVNPKNWPLAYNKNIWPAAALVVSGGHTEIYKMTSINKWKLLGKTLDDAVGEAFDKVGKMLNLPYPGGPKVSKLAALGNDKAFIYPRPMIKSKDYNFSFAGLKTAVLYSLLKLNNKVNQQTKADVCASFQTAALDVLITKTIKAAESIKAKSIIISGGVSANQTLRQKLSEAVKQLPNVKILWPELNVTGDNAAMIGLAAAVQTNFKANKKLLNNWQKLTANANWELWN